MYSLPQSYNQTSKCKRCISSNAYSCNNEWCLIEGKVPLNTSKDYASEVSSYTKGLGTFMVKPCGYQITKGGYSDNTRMEEKDKLLFMFEKSVSSK